MKVYYAHCLNIYDTKQEERDLELLRAMGFEVLNPNEDVHRDKALEIRRKVEEGLRTDAEREAAKGAGSEKVMEYFKELALGCDAVAFRALPCGSISIGVAKEIAVVAGAGKPVIELPSGMLRRTLTVEETREYLREAGQR